MTEKDREKGKKKEKEREVSSGPEGVERKSKSEKKDE